MTTAPAQPFSISTDPTLETVLSGSPLKAYTFADLKVVKFPHRPTVLARGDTPILRAGQLAQVFGERGVGKTLCVQSLALVMATGGSALGFRAPRASRVLYIDGEMAGEDIRDRGVMLADRLHLPTSPRLVVVAADWQRDFLPRLDTADGQAAIEPLVEWAEVVIMDNRSCLFDPEGEKDPSAWQPAQDYLLSLRRRGKVVILVHHANRQGGARGIGKAEDALDLVISLSHPDGYSHSQGARFVLDYTKTRGIPGGAALAPFEASLGPKGWEYDGIKSSSDVTRQRLLDLIRQRAESGQPIRTKTDAVDAISGKRKAKLDAWDDLLDSGTIERTPDGSGFQPAAARHGVAA